ncbi:22815_t:CDS:2, partial [Gigaspora margarita]
MHFAKDSSKAVFWKFDKRYCSNKRIREEVEKELRSIKDAYKLQTALESKIKTSQKAYK